jgi:ATP-binding cassette subfamily F protein 3
MLLDEPTTHLDLDGIKALTKAFQKFSGTVCFISHDLYFIREIADAIIDVNAGQIKTYPGGLDYYLEKKYGRKIFNSPLDKIPLSGGSSVNDDQSAPKKKNKQSKVDESSMSPELRQQHQKHQAALKRLNQIKNEIKNLREEEKKLDTESYVKSRQMSDSYGKDEETLKELGRRLKEIQSRLREIETSIEALEEEKRQITK